MTILSSLLNAYGKIADAPEFGFSTQPIHGCIVIDEDGNLVAPLVTWDRNKKGIIIPKFMNVPYFGGRSGIAAPPYFLWDNTAYIFGESEKENFDAAKRRIDFFNLHTQIFEDENNDELIAVGKFLSKIPEKIRAMIPKGAFDRNFVFRLKDRFNYVHESEASKLVWLRYFTPDVVGKAICLVSGNIEPIARIHPPISGFKDQVRIVSFDKDSDAFSSYGHIQSENAPIGIETAFKYTSVLNHFLRSESGHRVQIGDASTVYWADASDLETAKLGESVFSAMFADTPVDTTGDTRRVGDILQRIRDRRRLDEVAPNLAEGVRFYILGLAPNAARVSIRFWLEDDFGRIVENYVRFWNEMRIEPADQKGAPPLWAYLSETAARGKSENVPPNLAGEWMRAILSGTAYPMTILSTLLMRIRADGIVNARRVSMLKAILIRNFGLKEEIPVALEPENPNPAYQLGRLFAVLEAAQYAALGRVNATIGDRYYASASSTPARVFGPLLRGLKHHVSDARKRNKGGWIEPRVGEIIARLPPDLPRTLKLEDQGRFAVGYFHERSYRAKGTEPEDSSHDE